MADSLFTQMGSVISTAIDGVQANVDTEVTNRTNADTTLQTNIDAEETRALAAEAAVQTNVDNEETRALAAEAAIQSNVDAEETRALAAEATLQSNIDSIDLYDQSLNTTDNVTFNNVTVTGTVDGRDVNADGKLTDVFANAHSFVIKSTNPSYVGGDNWFNDENNPEPEFQVGAGNEEESQETFDARLATFVAAGEVERLKVDRIAFSGQVPVNVTGSFNNGDYIIAQDNGGAIEAVAVSEAAITFDQYKKAVGRVWTTEQDSRPRVAVKVG